MRKKALIVVSVLMVFNIGLLITKMIKPSMAFDEQRSDKSRITEIKTADEASKIEDYDNFYVDLVSLESTDGKINVMDNDFTIPEDLLNDLNNTVNNYQNGSAYLVVSLKDNMVFGYNVDASFSSASTIKAAYALYIYKLVADNKASLDDTISYEAKFYNKGTGNVKNSAYGTTYTVKDLIYQMIHESDNSAYLMLLNKYKWDGFNEMLDDLGTPESHLSNTSRWGKLSARGSAMIWQEIYRFSKTDDEGKELYDLLLNAKYNYFKEVVPELKSACKAGFTETAVHATGIVYENENPYIVIILSNASGNMNGAYSHVKNTFSKIYPVIQKYNEFIAK